MVRAEYPAPFGEWLALLKEMASVYKDFLGIYILLCRVG